MTGGTTEGAVMVAARALARAGDVQINLAYSGRWPGHVGRIWTLSATPKARAGRKP